MNLSASDIIERAMVKARIIAPGESIPADKLNQVYEELNAMLDSWSLEKLMVLADVLESFPLVSGQAEYSYGVGGDFNSLRPIGIRNESFIRDNGIDYFIQLKPLDTYRRQANKATKSRPLIMAYSPEYPFGRVFFFPTPTSTSPIHLRVTKSLTNFPDKTTAMNLAPGYGRTIISNLAVEISPNFGKKVSRELMFLAGQAKESIKSSNTAPIKSMTSDIALL